MLFKDYLTKLKQNKAIPQSLIVNTIHCCDYDKLAKTYLKTLTCAQQNPYCNNCDSCNRIEKNAYADFIYLTNDETLIKKEDIINIQETFNYVATESQGVKLYVIKDIEKSKKEVLNSMLKFLEDAPSNTYALFLTTNANRIIPTIRSRSTIITITDEEDHISNEDDEQYNNIIKLTFTDINEFWRYDEQNNYYEKYEIATQCVNAKTQVDIVMMSKILANQEKNDFYIILRTIANLVDAHKRMQINEMIDNLKLNINQKTTTIILFKILKG